MRERQSQRHSNKHPVFLSVWDPCAAGSLSARPLVLLRLGGFTGVDMPLLAKESILLGSSAEVGARQPVFSREGEAPAEPCKGSPGGSPSREKRHLNHPGSRAAGNISTGSLWYVSLWSDFTCILEIISINHVLQEKCLHYRRVRVNSASCSSLLTPRRLPATPQLSLFAGQK